MKNAAKQHDPGLFDPLRGCKHEQKKAADKRSKVQLSQPVSKQDSCASRESISLSIYLSLPSSSCALVSANVSVPLARFFPLPVSKSLSFSGSSSPFAKTLLLVNLLQAKPIYEAFVAVCEQERRDIRRGNRYYARSWLTPLPGGLGNVMRAISGAGGGQGEDG